MLSVSEASSSVYYSFVGDSSPAAQNDSFFVSRSRRPIYTRMELVVGICGLDDVGY